MEERRIEINDAEEMFRWFQFPAKTQGQSLK